MKKNVIILLFLVFSTAYCQIFVRYKGLDNTHIYVSHVVWYKCTVKLVCGSNVLFTKQLPEGGGVISENIKHSGLSNGSYTYQLLEDDNVVSSASAVIDGTITGWLLFDDNIVNPAVVSDVTVPSGKTLNINADITCSSSGGSIQGSGNIILKNGINVVGVPIYFSAGPVNLESIKGTGSFYFTNSATSGSTIKNCNAELVSVSNAFIEIEKTKVNYLSSSGTSTLNIKEVEIGSGCNFSKTSTINMNKCIINGKDVWWDVWELEEFDNFSASDSCFLKMVRIIGGCPQFNRCEFLRTVQLSGRNEAGFNSCIFGSSLLFTNSYASNNPKWSDNSNMQPSFSNNSFVGRLGPYCETPPPVPIDLGTNYYGDKNPDFEWFEIPAQHNYQPNYPQGGRFLKRGVPVNRAHFKVEQWNSTGQGLSCEKELPDIWVNDYIVGQNTIPWPDYYNTSRQNILIKGRETLLSLDVVTNYSSISGVKFKAIFDGNEIEPLNPSVVLGRSIPISGNDIFYGKATLNFILPPTQEDVANVVVMMDTTNISGFDDAQGKGEKLLLNINLTFSSAYKRQLNILVQPVQLFITGYTRRIPDGSAVANSLKNLIPAMLPIDKSQLHIWTAPVTTFYGGVLSMFSTTALLNRIANYLALGQGFLNTTAAIGDWLSGDEAARIDFIIAVMPKGVLGEGVTGANLALRRGIIFVDESAPNAALHEIGHGIGLYISPEQYDRFPPAGLPVEKLTAFINDANSCINGFRYRLLHFPGKDHPWYENRYWYDIMGSSTTLIWPIWNTLAMFRNYFSLSLLEAEKKSTISGTKVPAGYKRIFVSGETEKTSSGGYGYKFKQGTVKAFDITDFATGKIDVGVQWNSDDCASNDYTLICYDQNGTEIYSQQFTIITPYPMNFGWINLPNESSFCGTFDIPEQTRSYKIFPRPGWWNNNTDQPIFEVVYDTPIPIEIVSPTPGSVLSDSVEISWAASGKKQTNTSMQYAIMVSTDGGETWTPIGAPVEANKITLPTDFLTSSNNIIFKVIGSNGLDTTEDQVENLVLENRPPKAVIVSPLNNWVANTGTVWQFNGYGSDHEDGIIPKGIWTSSIDGTLNTDTDIVLSKGVHIITFEVQDSQGLKGSTTVQVEVKDMETVDIGIDDGNLTILIPNRDPLNSSPVLWLKENSVHNAVLKIKNTGTDTIFKASLYIKEPDSSQQRLLASNVFVPGPFEEVVLSETFLVATEGQYRFRAELTEITPPDENPANNEKIWTFQTKQAGLPVIQILPDLLDFDVSGSRKEGVFLIRNTGTDNLYITSLGISGQNPGEFSVDQTILNIPIPPDNEILVPVYFNPSSPGSKTAILNIFSNDVVNSPLRIELKGLCSAVKGDINSDGTTDISDVILCLRQAIGLDPVNVAAADMNDDGVVDISDVILVLRKAIGLD